MSSEAQNLLFHEFMGFILNFSQNSVNEWLQTVLDPLANFLLHGVISCSAEQQLKYLPEMDYYKAAVGILLWRFFVLLN